MLCMHMLGSLLGGKGRGLFVDGVLVSAKRTFIVEAITVVWDKARAELARLEELDVLLPTMTRQDLVTIVNVLERLQEAWPQAGDW